MGDFSRGRPVFSCSISLGMSSRSPGIYGKPLLPRLVRVSRPSVKARVIPAYGVRYSTHPASCRTASGGSVEALRALARNRFAPTGLSIFASRCAKTMAEFQIRFATQESFAEVTALLEAQLFEHQMSPPTDSLRQAIRSVIDNPRYGFILLAAGPDGSPVGAAYASSLLSLEYGGVSGWVEELYVTPAWRGQGIGSRLLEKVISTAKELGWRALDLEVDAAHERAIPLYQRYHFLPHSRSRFYLTLEN